MPNSPNRDGKLLLVVPSLAAGGAERVAALLARGLLARGYKIDLATIAGRDRDFYRLPPEVKQTALGLAGETSGPAAKLTANWRRLAGLRHTIRDAAPDAIIAFLPETNVLTIMAAAGSGVPVIATEHVDPTAHLLDRPWRLLRRLTYRRAAKVVSVSRGVDAAMAWLPAAQRAVVYNPVCLDEPEIEVPAFDWPHVVIGMGRLESQKGFDLLIDAFSRLASVFPDWGLAIFGEGSKRAELTARIESLALQSRIILPGLTPCPAAVFRRGDLFVLSSRYEGFGMALVEAMSCGLPVIAADCRSGPSEIVRSGQDGLLVPPGDAAALADAMRRLMADAGQRRLLGENARTAAKRFSLSAVIDDWERLLSDCLS